MQLLIRQRLGLATPVKVEHEQAVLGCRGALDDRGRRADREPKRLLRVLLQAARGVDGARKLCVERYCGEQREANGGHVEGVGVAARAARRGTRCS